MWKGSRTLSSQPAWLMGRNGLFMSDADQFYPRVCYRKCRSKEASTLHAQSLARDFVLMNNGAERCPQVAQLLDAIVNDDHSTGSILFFCPLNCQHHGAAATDDSKMLAVRRPIYTPQPELSSAGRSCQSLLCSSRSCAVHLLSTTFLLQSTKLSSWGGPSGPQV